MAPSRNLPESEPSNWALIRRLFGLALALSSALRAGARDSARAASRWDIVGLGFTGLRHRLHPPQSRRLATRSRRVSFPAAGRLDLHQVLLLLADSSSPWPSAGPSSTIPTPSRSTCLCSKTSWSICAARFTTSSNASASGSSTPTPPARSSPASPATCRPCAMFVDQVLIPSERRSMVRRIAHVSIVGFYDERATPDPLTAPPSAVPVATTPVLAGFVGCGFPAYPAQLQRYNRTLVEKMVA